LSNGVDDRGVPLPERPWQYSDALIRAMQAAAQIHGTQVRKDTQIPYLSHLLGACSIAYDYGANEEEAIAALLHDAIEDGRPIDAAKATVKSFGEEVWRIVDGCTDADEDPKPPWFERKQAYIASLATEDRSILLVSGSDKLHNARSIVRDLRAQGDKLWSRFSAPRECTLWYYRSLVTAYQQNPNYTSALVDELDRTVSEIEVLAGLHLETEAHRMAIASGEACRMWSTSPAAGPGARAISPVE
jgi:GTP pyrophosphokinase